MLSAGQMRKLSCYKGKFIKGQCCECGGWLTPIDPEIKSAYVWNLRDDYLREHGIDPRAQERMGFVVYPVHDADQAEA